MINRDLYLSQEGKFCIGGKIVRGAYIDEVRRNNELKA